MASGGGSVDGLKEIFDKYARFGKTETQLKEKNLRIESKNVQKMFKDTGVIDSKYTTQLLDNDIMRVLGRLYNAGTYARGVKTFDFAGFKQLVDQVAQSKKKTVEEITAKLNGTKGPSLANVTGTANKDITDRMTDTTLYTGSHKERFDAEGHGKGIDGRADRAENTGYVANYKEAGTYDERH